MVRMMGEEASEVAAGAGRGGGWRDTWCQRKAPSERFRISDRLNQTRVRTVGDSGGGGDGGKA